MSPRPNIDGNQQTGPERASMSKSFNIGFLLTPEHSCFNAAFGLAYALQARGHDPVFFVGYKSIFWDYVESHGFKAAKTTSLVESRAPHAHRPGGSGLRKPLPPFSRDAPPGKIVPLTRSSWTCAFSTPSARTSIRL